MRSLMKVRHVEPSLACQLFGVVQAHGLRHGGHGGGNAPTPQEMSGITRAGRGLSFWR